MTTLNGARVTVAGNAVSFERITFTRPATLDDTDYTLLDCSWFLEVWALPYSTGASPDVSLSIGSGIVRDTNTASSQVLDITLSSANLTALLGSNSQVDVFYKWAVTLASGAKTDVFIDNGWSGIFTVGNVAATASYLQRQG